MPRLQFSLVLLLLCVCVQNISCLYEDQIGKFDWRQQYIGKVHHALFDSSGKKIVVGTEENVVALLHAGTGKIEWRKILGSGSRHKIQSIFLIDNSKVGVIAGSPQTIQVFDLSNGVLHWESLLNNQETQPLFSAWGSTGNEAVLVEILNTKLGHYELSATKYNALTGIETDQETHLLEIFNQESKCHFTHPSLVCINQQQDSISFVNVKTGHSTQTSLSNLGHPPLSVTGINFVKNLVHLKTSDSSNLYAIESEKLKPLDLTIHGDFIILDPPAMKESNSLRYISILVAKGDTYIINIYDIDSKSILESVSGKISLPDHFGAPIYMATLLVRRSNGDLSFRYAITTSDHSFVYGSKKEVYWTREESLTSIIKVEMVDLPVSSIEASIEEEFGSDHQSGVIAHAIKRINSQLRQVAIIAQELLAGQLSFAQRSHSSASSAKDHLERDRFGLHKLILAVTKPGKLIAMDSLTGQIVWRRLLKDVDTDKLRLYVQRTSIHYPLEAQCTILAKSLVTGQSLLYVFRPVSGEPAQAGEKGYIHLGYSVQQAMLLPHTDETEHLKPLLLLDHHGAPHVHPHNEATLNLVSEMSKNLYIFTADAKSCTLKGYSLAGSSSSQLKATSVWQLQLCSESMQEEIVSMVSKNPDEKVHSQGRVLADRSVLYKYLNPNMVIVATAGNHPQHKGYLNIHLIDVVVGSIVSSISHRRTQPPYHVVYAENWVAYSYYNEKYRRTELGSLELFEGTKQINSTAFTSFAAPQPLVDRQAFIYPGHITTMKDTVSEQGMTAKHILIGLSNGWIQELPRAFLDPRRPSVPVATPEMREEGVMPYVPELPIPAEAVINYNQTVANVRNIYVTPSSLESTGLVFAYGLDIFYTQVTPSRTFDILSDDFEYVFIALVLAGLTLASIITKRLASKKSLRQAWK